MIERIRSTYVTVLESTELLDRETSDFAISKIKAMDKQVAFSDEYKNKTLIQQTYDHVSAIMHTHIM